MKRLLGAAALLALSACFTPRGVGGSGFDRQLSLDEARQDCLRAAEVQGYKDPQAKSVTEKSGERADVVIRYDSGWFTHRDVTCRYDARDDVARLPDAKR